MSTDSGGTADFDATFDDASSTGQEPGEPDGLDTDIALGEEGEDDIGDRSWSPPDRPTAVFDHGTTAGEAAEGGVLEDRLEAEVPDVGDTDQPGVTQPDLGEGDALGEDVSVEDTVVGDAFEGEVGDDRAGRLVAPDEGAHADEEKDLVADDVGIDAGAASAEEAAMHVVDDPRS